MLNTIWKQYFFAKFVLYTYIRPIKDIFQQFKLNLLNIYLLLKKMYQINFVAIQLYIYRI